jgi:hypothetical protein
MTISLDQIIYHGVVRRLVRIELERVLNVPSVTSFEDLLRHHSGKDLERPRKT